MNVTPAELVTQVVGSVLVDIRRPEEWRATGVIEGAQLLTFFDAAGESDPADWLRALGEIATADDDLVLICRSGHRTGIILNFLHNQTPYQHARHLAGGMLAWREEGLPVTPVSV